MSYSGAIILGLIFITFLHMAFPFYKFFKVEDKYTRKKVKEIIFYNTIVACILHMIILSVNAGLNIGKIISIIFISVFYYFFNYIIWIKFNHKNIKPDFVENEEPPDLTWDEFLKKNFPAQGTRTNMQNITIKKELFKEEEDKLSNNDNKKNIIDNYDNLKKLKELLDNNIITDKEFNEEKERILKERDIK